MYRCQICHYTVPDERFGMLSDDWVCPRCGVSRDEFIHESEAPGEDAARPEIILIPMIRALTVGLWKVLGKGSQAVTRDIGKELARNVETDPEDPLGSVARFFLDNGLAGSVEARENVLEVKNCMFYGLCSGLEDDGVLISTCPYTNTAAVVLEEVNGSRYKIKKLPGEYGHVIELSAVSKK